MSLTVKFLEGTREFAKWDEFVAANNLGTIHQLSLWGKFQAGADSLGSAPLGKFWILGVFDGTELVGGGLIIKKNLPFKKSWLYLPRGPLFEIGKSSEKILEKLFAEIRKLAAQEKAVWIRIDPPLIDSPLPKNLGFKKAHAHYQPENTLILDLRLTEKDLLEAMKPKGRYNIKVAEKNGVTVRGAINLHSDLEAYYELLNQTTSRDRFSGHNLQYYQRMLEELGPDLSKLYLAEYEGKIIAGSIVTFFKDTATYYFGASSNHLRNVMAPYLLQWEAIKEAKKRGLKFYDFLGVAPENSGSRHPWKGVTEFKLKFGGTRVDYLPALEIVLQPGWFLLIRLVKALHKLFK